MFWARAGLGRVTVNFKRGVRQVRDVIDLFFFKSFFYFLCLFFVCRARVFAFAASSFLCCWRLTWSGPSRPSITAGGPSCHLCTIAGGPSCQSSCTTEGVGPFCPSNRCLEVTHNEKAISKLVREKHGLLLGCIFSYLLFFLFRLFCWVVSYTWHFQPYKKGVW